MIQEFEKIRVLIAASGLVHWEPGGVFVTTCDIDIKYFPFDSQVCPIEIGAWAYKSSRMNLTNVDSFIETAQFKTNGEWVITATTAKWHEVVLPCCPDIRYSKVVYTLYMDRRYIFYLMNIILPCTLLSILILVVFCVPPDAGEKISAGISVLLAFTVFLLMLADNVPRTSLDVPILVLYLGSTMALGTLSVCLTVCILNLHHRGSARPVPDWARAVFLTRLAPLFGFPPVSAVDDSTDAGTDDDINFRRDDSVSLLNNHPPPPPPLLSTNVNGATDFFEERPHIKRSNSTRKTFSGTGVGAGRNSNRDTESMLMMDTLLSESLRYHNVTLPPPRRFDRRANNIVRRATAPAVSAPPAEGGTGKGGGGPTAAQRETVRREWHLLARVLDRILFCVVFFTMLCCALFILLSPWYMGNRGHRAS